MQFPDRTWEVVRLESGDRGRRLVAMFTYRGLELGVRVDEGDYELRWRR